MNLKREAAKALAAHLEAVIPSLAGRVHTVHAEPETYAAYPSLYILPSKMRLETAQDLERDDAPRASVLVEVGSWVGTWELRIPGRSPYERQELEELVLQEFLAREGAPSTLVVAMAAVELDGVASTHRPSATFCLDAAEWDEEKSFSKQRYSFLDIDVEYPALTVRRAAPIEEPILAIGELDADTPDEEVVVDADGGIEHL